jgi:two-component system chemotaxis response regulator CheY
MKQVKELDKPSLFNSSNLFAEIHALLVDSDHKIATLVRKLLASLGCKKVFIVHDGLEAIDLMKHEHIDLVITDWQLKAMNGLELTTYLRRSLDSPNRMIPIIMLTARNDRSDIQTARDTGVSEYLIKPFSAKSLLERVQAVAQDPRAFILCKNYVGPDRRRISSLSLPPDPDEAHTFIERKPAMIVPKEQLKELILDDTPRMIMPDYTLKQKIGMEVPVELITNPLTVAASEDEISKAQAEFMQAMLKDVETLEESYQALIKSPDNTKKLVGNIKDAAFSIKSRAGIFGYIRATEVANQLYNFCRRYYDKDNKYHLIILEKHIQTIVVIFSHKITGDGGAIGAELMRDLAKLINKYLNRKD